MAAHISKILVIFNFVVANLYFDYHSHFVNSTCSKVLLYIIIYVYDLSPIMWSIVKES
jgi:hypothetical protein